MPTKAPKRARKAVKAVRKVPKKRARKAIRARRVPLAPRIIDGEREVVAFRVSTGEKETLEQIALTQGVAVSEVIRQSIQIDLDLPIPQLKKREELISSG